MYLIYLYRSRFNSTGCVDVRSAVREFSIEFTLLCNRVPRNVSHPFSSCPTTVHDEEAGRIPSSRLACLFFSYHKHLSRFFLSLKHALLYRISLTAGRKSRNRLRRKEIQRDCLIILSLSYRVQLHICIFTMRLY